MPRVAIVTGGSSGIGLGLTQHLVAKGWHVVIADINAPPASANLPSDLTKYIHCDVSSWASQASMFAEAFEWHSRLDFAALNAGIDDRDDIFDSIDPSTPPSQPNMLTFATNLLGVYHGIKLAAHYLSRNNSSTKGHITITSSSAGLYALPAVPQYTAAKYGLIGLTRALAPRALQRGIYLNALCPAVVATNLAPAGLMEHFPEEHRTPMSSITRAFDELLDPVAKRSGCVAEVAVQDVFYREEVEPLSRSQVRMSRESLEVWDRVYRERNVGFAREGAAGGE